MFFPWWGTGRGCATRGLSSPGIRDPANPCSAPPSLVTSALVVAEGHGWFLRRYDRNRALQFLAFIEALKPLTIQPFDASELGKASRVAKRFSGQKLTLADAHGLVIMSERRPASCWSTDRHLGLGGVPLAV